MSQIAGRPLAFVQADIRETDALNEIFSTHRIEAVMHFAGLKAVGESVLKPLAYYENNVGGTLKLLEAMAAHRVHKLVFSSSATVYGQPKSAPIGEDAPFGAANPYGRTKVMIEEILRDLAHADDSWRIAVLRYFNPAGAHESGLIGEDPKGIPNNLVPYISQVAVGRRDYLSVWGNDYPTPDGTGIRDYIHVVDLATGHVAALNKLEHASGVATYNLGTGRGHSVLEMIRAFEQASGRPIPYRIAGRTSGRHTCLLRGSKKGGARTTLDRNKGNCGHVSRLLALAVAKSKWLQGSRHHATVKVRRQFAPATVVGIPTTVGRCSLLG